MRIVVLTKVPVPGQVKTRLAGLLTPEGSARLHEALALETVRRALSTALPVTVSLAGPLDHPFADRLCAAGAHLEAQVPGDLGARLAHALRGPGRVLALGADCVTFDPSWLTAALADPTPSAFGPSNDGGYWSVACEGTGGPLATERLFQAIPWSTPETLSASLAAAGRAGIASRLLPESYDIDEPMDLRRLQKDPACTPELRDLVETLLGSG